MSLLPLVSAAKCSNFLETRLFRSIPTLAVFGHDVVVAAASFIISLHIRLGHEAWESFQDLFPAWLMFTGVCACVFWFSRAARGVWRYFSLRDLVTVIRAISLAILIYLRLTFLVTRLEGVPRSTLIINWLVLFVLIVAPRIALRIYNDGGLRHLLQDNHSHSRIPLLLIGSGDAAELFIREMARDLNAPYEVLGLIDENRSRIGLSIHGLPVMGHPDELLSILNILKSRGKMPQRLILTQPLHRMKMQKVMEVAEFAGVSVSRMPRLTDFRSGSGERFEIQPIAVEDLLGRTQTKLENGTVSHHITGHRVLVTGAGGSIGSELVRQIAALSPAHLSLLDAGEMQLYNIDLEVAELHPDLSRRAILADVRDRQKLDAVMAMERPTLVFHAAALKHVPLVEANKLEGILTNAIGTRIVADACHRAGVSAMVLISTDKAVNPANTMGAAKRLAEAYCQALNTPDNAPQGDGLAIDGGTESFRRPRFITVRFGNVLGSSGSVVPLFKRQLAKGGPLTITHPDMARYFMTISEAVELVLQALAMGMEDADKIDDSIYVLNMGKPVKIMDVAQQMIRLAGFRPGVDVKIKITGLRAGEKLNEELFHDSEELMPTDNPGLWRGHPRHADLESLRRHFDELAEACSRQQEDRVVQLLPRFVPEFVPTDSNQ
jgi:O-antigen biosynthesis protein WbqV